MTTQRNQEATAREAAIEALTGFFNVPENNREKLLTTNRSYTIGLLNSVYKGFAEVSMKYDHILIMAAQMHQSISMMNNLLMELIEVVDQSIEGNIEVAQEARKEANEGAIFVAELLEQNATIFESIRKGVKAIIEGNSLVQETFVLTPAKDEDAELILDGEIEDPPNADRVFASDFREALAFYLSKRSEFNDEEMLKSNIDEAALNAALEQWSKARE